MTDAQDIAAKGITSAEIARGFFGVQLLYADALSEKGEGGGTYLDMFKHNISLLAPAMAGS